MTIKMEIEGAVLDFTLAIQEVACKAIPEDTFKHDSCEVPLETERKLAEKRQLRNIWQETRYPGDKTKLNRETKELKHLLSSNRNAKIQQLEEISDSADPLKPLWRMIKRAKRPLQTPFATPMAPAQEA